MHNFKNDFPYEKPDLLYPPYDDNKKKILNSVADGIKIPVAAIVGGVAVAAGAAVFIASKL